MRVRCPRPIFVTGVLDAYGDGGSPSAPPLCEKRSAICGRESTSPWLGALDKRTLVANLRGIASRVARSSLVGREERILRKTHRASHSPYPRVVQP